MVRTDVLVDIVVEVEAVSSQTMACRYLGIRIERWSSIRVRDDSI